MSTVKPTFWLPAFAVGIAVAGLLGVARAQAPGGYGQYFQKKAWKAPTGGVPSSNGYLYDKYFYHRPTVSPYMNVFRPDPVASTSYQAYVRPEQQRRAATATANRAYVQQRKLEGRVGETRHPGAGYVGGTPQNAWMKTMPKSLPVPKSPTTGYYNRYYGGWTSR